MAQIGHDLLAGLTLLRASKRLTLRAVKTQHHRPPQEEVPARTYHQAFRYGIPVEQADDVVTDLRSVLRWIKERL